MPDIFEGGWRAEQDQGKNIVRPTTVITCRSCQHPDWIWSHPFTQEDLICFQCIFELEAFGSVLGVGSGVVIEVTQQIADKIQEKVSFFG